MPCRRLAAAPRRGLAALSALAIAAWVAPSLASEGYPEAVVAHVEGSVVPGCDTCHHAALDPVGAVDTPFGAALVARGLVGDDVASLGAALDAMAADGVDSDGDGAKDLDELHWGGDPNAADRPIVDGTQPVTYGCAIGGRGDGASLLAALLLALWLARRAR